VWRRVHYRVRDIAVSLEFTNINTQPLRYTARLGIRRFGKEQAQPSGLERFKCIAYGGCLLPNYLSLDVVPFVMIPILKTAPFLSPGHHGTADHSTVEISNDHAGNPVSLRPLNADVSREVRIAHSPVAEQAAIVDLGRLVFGDKCNPRLPRVRTRTQCK
jgi:hypothetical protein